MPSALSANGAGGAAGPLIHALAIFVRATWESIFEWGLRNRPGNGVNKNREFDQRRQLCLSHRSLRLVFATTQSNRAPTESNGPCAQPLRTASPRSHTNRPTASTPAPRAPRCARAQRIGRWPHEPSYLGAYSNSLDQLRWYHNERRDSSPRRLSRSPYWVILSAPIKNT